VDFDTGICEVNGVSSVSVLKQNSMEIYPAGAKFSLGELGQFTPPSSIEQGLRPDVWQMVVNAAKVEDDAPSAEALELLEQRKNARARKDFAESDRLRDQITALGWIVQDSKEGQKLVRK
jgi:cysteinyl-tRNA synthetase